MNYQLDKNEQKMIWGIEKSFYMKPILKRVKKFIQGNKDKNKTWKDIFNHICDILLESKNDVEKILIKRRKEGKIKDVKQSIKSIAGNSFSNIVIYIFLQNKVVGNIKSKIFITNKKSQIKNFKDISTIYIDKEIQKPDIDLIIFTKKKNEELDKCIILSLKTSLRERAGQTYKWKLLLEIATSNNPIKKKYNIYYASKKMPLICFATTNFYKEINSSQNRGMFKFFDKSFIAKPVNNKFISPLSHLVNFVNQKL